MEIRNVIILVISILTILLGFLILRKNPKNQGNFWYFWMCFFGGAWGVMKYIQFSVFDIYLHEMFISRLVMFFGSLAPFAFLMFSFYFIYRYKGVNKEKIYTLLFISTSFALLFLFSFFNHAQIYIIDGSLYREIEFIDFLLFSVYFFAYIFYALKILYSKYSTADSIYRKQLKYLIVGTMSTFLSTGLVSVIFLLFDIFSYDWLGVIFLSFHVSIIGYTLFIKPHISEKQNKNA